MSLPDVEGVIFRCSRRYGDFVGSTRGNDLRCICMSNSTSIPYIMGRTARERRRLLLQGAILQPVTERFLWDAGISPGMRILDLGCGIGDVALIAAQMSGLDGEVVGIDTDGEALAFAERRARDTNLRHVRFEHADILEYRSDEPFDAVVLRHVLIHTADPVRIARKAVSLLRAGGIAAFQEYDLSSWPAGYPAVPLVSRLQEALIGLFQKATPHANIGMRVGRIMQEAGLHRPRSYAESLIENGPESLFHEWLAETVRSLMPALEILGLTEAAGDPETLADRLRSGTIAAQASLTTPLIVSTSARKP